MAVILTDGSVLSIATAYATSKNMTAITNATEAVATLEASHGIVVGDIFEVTSGWPGLDGRVVRAKTVATNDVTLEGVDTTDTGLYPAGSGTGTIREVTTWAAVSQVLRLATEGGEQQYFTYQFMDRLFQSRVPTFQDPATIKLGIADDASLSYLSTIRAAQATQTVRAARLVFRNSHRILLNGFWSLGFMPQLTLNEPKQRSIDLAVTAAPSELTS